MFSYFYLEELARDLVDIVPNNFVEIFSIVVELGISVYDIGGMPIIVPKEFTNTIIDNLWVAFSITMVFYEVLDATNFEGKRDSFY